VISLSTHEYMYKVLTLCELFISSQYKIECDSIFFVIKLIIIIEKNKNKIKKKKKEKKKKEEEEVPFDSAVHKVRPRQ